MQDGVIHVFQCKGGSAYGFTRDRTGANLPKADCAGGWAFFRSLETEPFDLPRLAVDTEQVHDDIGRTGYSVVHWSAGPG